METEVTVLEKLPDFTSIQNTLTETELRKYFEEFLFNQNLRNEATNNFSETPDFRLKSGWRLLKGHPSFELFLTRVEKEFFFLMK